MCMKVPRTSFVLFALALGVCAASSPGASRKTKCSELVVRLFQKGIHRRDSIGVHGTSLQAIEHILQTGRLLPSVGAGNEGQIYIFPNMEHPQIQHRINTSEIKVVSGILDENDPHTFAGAMTGATNYAGIKAQEHGILRELGLPITPESASHAFDYWYERDSAWQAIAYFERNGFTREQLIEARKKTLERKGVILSFGTDAFSFRLRNAARDDHGLRFEAPQGMPARVIEGIEPLGDYEYRFFERLQSQE